MARKLWSKSQSLRLQSITAYSNSFLFLPRQWRPFHISTVDRRHAAEAMKTLAPEKNTQRVKKQELDVKVVQEWAEWFTSRTSGFESLSDHYLNLFLGRPEFKSRATISTWSSKPCQGIPVCRAKAVLSFLSFFRIPNIGLPRGSNPRLPAQQSSLSCRGC